MSEQVEGYNGWRNYETWAVKLWMDNDEPIYVYWRNTAQRTYNAARADESFSREERAALDLAVRLKSEHEEKMPELGDGVWTDLLEAAFSEVFWYEIAP